MTQLLFNFEIEIIKNRIKHRLDLIDEIREGGCILGSHENRKQVINSIVDKIKKDYRKLGVLIK